MKYEDLVIGATIPRGSDIEIFRYFNIREKKSILFSVFRYFSNFGILIFLVSVEQKILIFLVNFISVFRYIDIPLQYMLSFLGGGDGPPKLDILNGLSRWRCCLGPLCSGYLGLGIGFMGSAEGGIYFSKINGPVHGPVSWPFWAILKPS